MIVKIIIKNNEKNKKTDINKKRYKNLRAKRGNIVGTNFSLKKNFKSII